MQNERVTLERYLKALEAYELFASIDLDALRRALPLEQLRLTTIAETHDVDNIGLDLNTKWGALMEWHEALMDRLAAKVRARLPELIREVQADAKRELDREGDYVRGVLRLEPLEGALSKNGRSLADLTKTKFNPAKDSPETAVQMARVIAERDANKGAAGDASTPA